MPTETNSRRKGILALITMLILIVLVILLSGPVYRLFTGGSLVYTSVQQGYGGEVTVKLSVKDDTIDSIQAEGLSETPGIGQKAIAQYNETVFAGFSGRTVHEISAELDAVSGATVTSTAVKAGLEDVLAQAGTASAEKEP